MVSKSNKKWLEDAQEVIDAHPYEEMIHQLITDLSQYRQITSYALKLEQIKKESNDRHYVESNVQEFMQKMDEILKGEG